MDTMDTIAWVWFLFSSLLMCALSIQALYDTVPGVALLSAAFALGFWGIARWTRLDSYPQVTKD